MYLLIAPLQNTRCVLHHAAAPALEEWISTKDFTEDKPWLAPKWHVPCSEEIHFANELLKLHFDSPLDDLLKICKSKIHSDPGNYYFFITILILERAICQLDES